MANDSARSASCASARSRASTCASATAVAAPALLSDRALLDVTEQVAGDERRTTAELLALLAELDTRRLYLGEGYSSLFTYCTHRLRLSESAAYGRITAARAARRFPTLLSRLAEGDVTLTSISLLAAHLTDDNHESLLDAARHASRRDVERLVASLHAQPDIPASVRRIPSSGGPTARGELPTDSVNSTPLQLPSEPTSTEPASAASEPTRTPPRPALAPLAADRYLLRLTIDEATHEQLERARDLLRHSIPNGDPARVIGRALIVLVEQLEKRKAGRLSRPERAAGARPAKGRAGGALSAIARAQPSATGSDAPPVRASEPRTKRRRGRHVPSAVKRVVWSRDEGRCAFVGPQGRCGETGFLEYHHVVPFADGGASGAANLELRCRAHNAYEAAVWFGEDTRPGAKAPGR